MHTNPFYIKIVYNIFMVHKILWLLHDKDEQD
jgi:hypothetical protein